MRRKLEKYKLFNKKLDIDDFSIRDFVEWMSSRDLSPYITVAKKEIIETTDSANIVVINIDGIVVQGAIVTIDGLGWHAETDENGVCVISGFPASEQHLVNVAAEGYEVFSEYHSTQEIKSLTVILQKKEGNLEENNSENNLENNSENNSEEEPLINNPDNTNTEEGGL